MPNSWTLPSCSTGLLKLCVWGRPASPQRGKRHASAEDRFPFIGHRTRHRLAVEFVAATDGEKRQDGEDQCSVQGAVSRKDRFSNIHEPVFPDTFWDLGFDRDSQLYDPDSPSATVFLPSASFTSFNSSPALFLSLRQADAVQ